MDSKKFDARPEIVKLHFLTLTWNGADKLSKLYSSLQPNLLKLPMETHWHIRDNGSKDETISLASSWDNTTLYQIGHNRDNFARGVNYLFEQANPDDEDLILLLNNDVIFNDDSSLKHMLGLMQQTNAIAVGAKLLYTDTNKIQHCGVAFGERYGGMPWHLKRGETSDAITGQNRYFQAITAAVCLIKSKNFKEVGGMSGDFFWAFEDIDLCLRLSELGKIAYCGQTNIFHEESGSLKKNPVNKLFLQQNVSLFKSKWWKDGKPTYKLDYDKYLNDSGYNLIE